MNTSINYGRSKGNRVGALTNSLFSTQKQFKFNPLLDVHYLDEFYQEDLEQALILFEIFLKHTIKECQHIFKYAAKDSYHYFHQLVHKVRPSFQMVGLTKINNILGELEEIDSQQFKEGMATPMLRKLKEMLQQYLPIIKNEVLRLKRNNT